MIKGYEKFRLLDEAKEGEFYIEVNWNLRDSKINECKILRVVFPGGRVIHIKREALLAVLFALGTPQEQIDLIPQRQISIRQYQGLVRMKAKKDIAKGEMIVAHVNLSLKPEEQEIIR